MTKPADTSGRTEPSQSSIGRRELLLRGGATAASVPFLMPSVAWGMSRDGFRVVETARGKLRGRVSGGTTAFKGISYGASTEGTNRFLPPQPVQPWRGVRDALGFGSQCPQFNPDYPAWLDSAPATEDCLVLNVWAPEHASQATRLPVMVWIHGGGFTFGSAGAPLYDCSELARAGNVIAVSINHRLNIFGYSFFDGSEGERFATAGNAGQLDIVAALAWVRDNIEAFGGDASNVTLFGESGGGGKISALLNMPLARGLFHKAIVQSGSLLRVREPADAAALTHHMYADLGIRPGDVRSLQQVPTATLLQCHDRVTKATRSLLHPSLFYGPVVDGRVIHHQSWEGSAPKYAHDIPMIIGTNLHETAGFVGPGLAEAPGDDRSLAARLAEFAVINSFDVDALLPAIQEYRKAMPALTKAELMVRISSDIGFWKNAVQQTELKSADGSAPVFSYECAWRTPCFGGKWAVHGVELPFIFGISQYGIAWDGEDSDASRARADPHDERLRVGGQMFHAWTNFARSGNPSTQDLVWPAYNVSVRPTMVFDAHSQVVGDLRSDVRPIVQSL